jgi:hypothetical protein
MNKQDNKRSSSADPPARESFDLDLLVDDPKADLPSISALETPAQRSRTNIRHLQATEQTLQQRIKDLEFELSLVEAHTKNRLQDVNIPVGPSAPPSVPESPGPHCLQPKPERPADIAYKQKLEQQRHAESAITETTEDMDSSPDKQLLSIFKSLTKVLQTNNDHLQSSDVSEPSKFNGLDTQWDDFYLQLRTYLEAKGWLVTFEHPHGPGSPGFDNEINKKIYNKLLTLCRKGTAATYITKAALSNGWEAARYLLDRYEGFSKQREKSLRNLVDNLRHVNGTNISRHVDRFEKICGLMAHNNPSKPPTEEEKIVRESGSRSVVHGSSYRPAYRFAPALYYDSHTALYSE